jgi:hypothetical protein
MFWNKSSDPYWNPPEEEVPRTQRVLQGVRDHVKDLSRVLFVVIKSWNDNCVLYEYDDTGSNVVTTSWLSVEPEDKERHEKLGNPSLRSYLNPAEDLLFGCVVSVVEGDRFLVKINQEQLSSRTFELVMDSSGNPAVIGSVNGQMCRVEHAYVQMKKGLVPEAEYMNFYGKSLTDGSRVVEHIVG